MINQSLTLGELRATKFNAYVDGQIFLKLFLFSIAGSLAFLTIYFVFQTNAQMSEAGLIANYEKRVAELKEANNNLEISVVDTSSMDKILPLINEMNFEKSVNVSFIKVSGEKVVVNKN
jgi:cell division protein FtsL